MKKRKPDEWDCRWPSRHEDNDTTCHDDVDAVRAGIVRGTTPPPTEWAGINEQKAKLARKRAL